MSLPSRVDLWRPTFRLTLAALSLLPLLQLSRLFTPRSKKPDPTAVVELEGTMTIPANVPKGLYLYGTVGTGKSMVRFSFAHSSVA